MIIGTVNTILDSAIISVLRYRYLSTVDLNTKSVTTPISNISARI